MRGKNARVLLGHPDLGSPARRHGRNSLVPLSRSVDLRQNCSVHGPGPATPSRAAAEFAAFAATRDPRAFARAFDATAPDLLLVAARLTRRSADAQDLLQQTWLAAIQRGHAFDPARPLLPWLIGILVQQARMRRRAGARAAAREHAHAAPPSPAPDPAGAAMDAELHEHLAAALGQLDERLRLVLVLRLVHGLSSVEIGRALGRPPDTVRVQLARGLARLRRLLPAGHAMPASLLLLPVDGVAIAEVKQTLLAQSHAEAATTVAAGVAVAGTGLGVIAMKKLLLAGIATLVAALAVGSAWQATSSTPEQVPLTAAQPVAPMAGGRMQPTHAGDTTDAGSAAPHAREQVAAAAPIAPAPTVATIRGRCIDETGAPLAGVHVSVSGPEHGTPAPQQTGSDGRFEVVLADVGEQRYGLRFAAPGRATRAGAAWHDAKALRLGGAFDLGDLLLPLGAPIRGRFVDAQRQPVRVPYLELSASLGGKQTHRWTAQFACVAVVTDSSEFVTEPLEPETWHLVVKTRGWHAPPLQVEHSIHGSQVELLIEPVPAIRGLVVDERGRPLAGMQVSAQVDQPGYWNNMHVVTGEDGRFALLSDARQRAGNSIRICVSDFRQRYGWVEQETSFGGAELRVVLPRMAELRVRVEDAETGDPIHGAVVGWSPDLAARCTRTAANAKEGDAVLRGLPQVPVLLAAAGPTSGPHRAMFQQAVGIVREIETSQPDVVIRLPRARTYWVKVLVAGQPTDGVLVELLEADADPVTAEQPARELVAHTALPSLRLALRLGSGHTGPDGIARIPLRTERTPLVIRISGERIRTALFHAPFARGAGTDANPLQFELD